MLCKKKGYFWAVVEQKQKKITLVCGDVKVFRRVKHTLGWLLKYYQVFKKRTNDVYTFRSTKASANIEDRPEFSYLVGLFRRLSNTTKKPFAEFILGVSTLIQPSFQKKKKP